MTIIKKARRMARPAEAAADAILAPTEVPTSIASPAAPKRTTKQDLVLELLRRAGGTTLAEMVEATGWLPHTTRAALTGIRKKGHDAVRSKVDGETRYAIVAAPAQ